MDNSLLFIFLIFSGINISIVWSDIRSRKIPNTLLLLLLTLLPLWWYLLPGDPTKFATLVIISCSLVLGGILLNTTSNFLGSGDIKYMAILILFLGQYSLPILIGNIGILTIGILIFWWSMILGQIYVLRGHITRDNRKLRKKFEGKINPGKIFLSIFDWVIIGFFLSMIVIDISIQLSLVIPENRDFYFCLSLLIFLVRPGFRYILTEWRHRIFPILGMFLYFGFYFQKNGGEFFLGEMGYFINNIWLYALGLILTSFITRKTFSVYDGICERTGAKIPMNTIPYSVVIFGGFILTYFVHINLVQLIRMM